MTGREAGHFCAIQVARLGFAFPSDAQDKVQHFPGGCNTIFHFFDHSGGQLADNERPRSVVLEMLFRFFRFKAYETAKTQALW